LKTGESFQVTLTFATAGEVVVDVPVMEDAP
jgi:copper(I)-binding protein